MKRGVPLAELPLAEFQAAHPALDKQVFEVLGVEHAVAAFTSYGSTNPEPGRAPTQQLANETQRRRLIFSIICTVRRTP